MPRYFDCPHLGIPVELTDEREAHIREAHPDLGPPAIDLIADTIGDPDEIFQSRRSTNARRFVRWYHDLLGGNRLVVVVIDEPERQRHWVITAHISSKPLVGVGCGEEADIQIRRGWGHPHN